MEEAVPVVIASIANPNGVSRLSFPVHELVELGIIGNNCAYRCDRNHVPLGHKGL
jgi:hypothetical protein